MKDIRCQRDGNGLFCSLNTELASVWCQVDEFRGQSPGMFVERDSSRRCRRHFATLMAVRTMAGGNAPLRLRVTRCHCRLVGICVTIHQHVIAAGCLYLVRSEHDTNSQHHGSSEQPLIPSVKRIMSVVKHARYPETEPRSSNAIADRLLLPLLIRYSVR